MADIINSPNNGRGTAGIWIAIILGIVLVLLLLIAFFPEVLGMDARNPTPEQVEETTPNDSNPIVIPPPTVNNTVINSTSTINLGATTTATTTR